MFYCSSLVTTVYPVEEFDRENVASEDIIVETLEDIIPPTQSFFPTVAAIQTLESFHNLETHTFLPFIPNILPEVTPAAEETPSAGLWEHTEGTAEEPADVRMLETVTGWSHGGEAEPEERLTPGKTPPDRFI